MTGINLIHRILQTLPFNTHYQEWKDDGDGFYVTQIFENQQGFEPHSLVLGYSPKCLDILEPISPKQRREMIHPELKGPPSSHLDTAFFIYKGMITDEPWESLIFGAYFLKGRFVYGDEHEIPGHYDHMTLVRDFNVPEQFTVRINEYFGLNSYEKFRQFFTRSNLPETHVKALEAILK